MVGHRSADIEEVWHGLRPPYMELFAWLVRVGTDGPTSARGDLPAADAVAPDRGQRARVERAARSSPPNGNGTASACRLRTKAARSGCSRAPAMISPAPFPMWSRRSPRAWCWTASCWCRQGEVAPFNDLQQRLNRKTRAASMRQIASGAYPPLRHALRARRDLRELPFTERRARLEAWHGDDSPPRTDLSPIVYFDLRRNSRRPGPERARRASKD